MAFFGCNALKFVSMNNQECKIRSEIIDVNSNEPIFYPYSIELNKCSGSCNNISDPYAKLSVPDIIKNINVKIFNLMSRTNETRHIKRHELHKCKCRLDTSVCNNKQRWNNNKYGANVNNSLIMDGVIKNLFRILVIMNVNVINSVMLKNI